MERVINQLLSGVVNRIAYGVGCLAGIVSPLVRRLKADMALWLPIVVLFLLMHFMGGDK